MFLAEIWKCAGELACAGKVIAGWFKNYCEHHGISPDVLNSLRDDHSGLGTTEKEEQRRTRLFQEKSQQLARELWEQNGRPEGGPEEFLNTARAQLTQVLQG
jgi:hypothetical protein